MVDLLASGNSGHPTSPGCHEESEARIAKVNYALYPAGLRKLLYPWPDPPTPVLLTGGGGQGLEGAAHDLTSLSHTLSLSQAVVDLLASGPKGRHEGPLLKALRERRDPKPRFLVIKTLNPKP